MKVESIEIYTGKPDFEFTPIRPLEVKCEATNALMPAPTIEEANGRLRALAAKVGANAITEVEYNSGISFTSWKSLKATGVAGTRVSDEVACEVCFETIKRQALKCRHCGSERDPQLQNTLQAAKAVPEEVQPTKAAGHSVPYATTPGIESEPLRDNNNPVLIIGLVVFGLFIFMLVVGSA